MEKAMGSSAAQEPGFLQERRGKPNSSNRTAAFNTYTQIQEYAATLILPLSNIINAVEIDPISRSKAHCMQIIAEEKSYRFCAPSEDSLAEWLGALKSQLAKRKEASVRKGTAA